MSWSGGLKVSVGTLPNPVGASGEGWGDKLWDKIKSLVRGPSIPEHRVVSDGSGGYHLLRKGQAGAQRVGPAPQPLQAVAAQPLAAVPGHAPAAPGPVPNPGGPPAHAPANVNDLRDAAERILGALAGPAANAPILNAPILNAQAAALSCPSARQRDSEARRDIAELSRLASTPDDLKPMAANRDRPAEAFGKAVANLVAARLPGAGNLLADMLAAPSDALDLVATHTNQTVREIARQMVGTPDTATDARARGDARDHLRSLMTHICEDVQLLQSKGLLTADLTRSIAAVEPLAAWSNATGEKGGIDHLQALAGFGELLHALARGNAPVIGFVLGGDSRNDALVSGLRGLAGPDEGDPPLVPDAADRLAKLRDQLDRAKRDLATVWRQAEKTGTGYCVAKRLGHVINPGGSAQLRVDTGLVMALRNAWKAPGAAPGPQDARSRLAERNDGMGLQADSKAGRSLNLQIARVMLLQKRIDAVRHGGAPQPVDVKQEALRPALAVLDELPRELRGMLGLNGDAELATFADDGRAKDLSDAYMAQKSAHEARVARMVLQGAARTAGDVLASLDGTIGRPENTPEHPFEPARRADAVRALLNGGMGQLAREAKAERDRLPGAGSRADWTRALLEVERKRDVAAQAARAKLPNGVTEAHVTALGPLVDALRLYGEAVRKEADPDAMLGLDGEDLKQAGYAGTEQEFKDDVQAYVSGHDASQGFANFVRQGLASTGDVKTLGDAARSTFDGVFGKGRDSHLAQGLMQDVSRQFPEARGQVFLASTSAMPGGLDDRFDQLDDEQKRDLADTATVTRCQAAVATGVADLGTMDREMADARSRLGQPDATADGIKADGRNTRRHAALLVELHGKVQDRASAEQNLRRLDDLRPDQRQPDHAAATRAAEQAKEAAEQGMRDIERNLRSMNTRSLGWTFPGVRRNLNQLEQLVSAKGIEVAKAIRTLADTPARRELKAREVAGLARDVDDAMTARATLLQEGGISPGQLMTAIRRAAVRTALDTGQPLAEFDGGANRATVIAKLDGLPENLVGPELDDVLSRRLDPDTLDAWQEEADRSSAAAPPTMARTAASAVTGAAKAVVRFYTDTNKIGDASRQVLTEAVKALQPGDSLRLARGWRGSLDTTRIPVEASGTLTARLTAAMNSRNALEVRRTSAGCEVFFQSGKEGSGTGEFTGSILGFARVGATLGGGGGRLSGGAIVFPDTATAAAFLDAMLENKPVSPKLWEQATDTALVKTGITTAMLQGEASASLENLAAKVPGGDSGHWRELIVGQFNVKGAELQILGGVDARAGVSGKWQTSERRNAEQRVVEMERSTVIQASVMAGLWSSIPTVQDAALNVELVANSGAMRTINGLVARHDLKGENPEKWGPDNQAFDPVSPASADQFANGLLSVGFAGDRTITQTFSLTHERDGLLSRSGNALRVSVPVRGNPLEDKVLGALSVGTAKSGSSPLQKAVDTLKAQDGDRMTAFLAAASPGDTIAASYALKDEVREEANDALKLAARERDMADRMSQEGRYWDSYQHSSAANGHESRAKALYENAANYVPDTISIVKSADFDRSTTLFSVAIVSVGRLAQGGVERPAIILPLPGGPTAPAGPQP